MRWPWVLRSVYEEALRDKRVAEDRLYAAWREGYVVPPRQAVEVKEKEPIRLLPAKLTSFIENWESDETRQQLEIEARRMHYDLGMTEDRVLELFEARTGNGDS